MYLTLWTNKRATCLLTMAILWNLNLWWNRLLLGNEAASLLWASYLSGYQSTTWTLTINLITLQIISPAVCTIHDQSNYSEIQIVWYYRTDCGRSATRSLSGIYYNIPKLRIKRPRTVGRVGDGRHIGAGLVNIYFRGTLISYYYRYLQPSREQLLQSVCGCASDRRGDTFSETAVGQSRPTTLLVTTTTVTDWRRYRDGCVTSSPT